MWNSIEGTELCATKYQNNTQRGLENSTWVLGGSIEVSFRWGGSFQQEYNVKNSQAAPDVLNQQIMKFQD